MGRRGFLSWLGVAVVAPHAVRAQPSVGELRGLGGLPTPITQHEALARELGLGSLFVKRDDQAGVPFGGSKARKLEGLLADAIARGHDAVLTFGGVGSNHALATAVHARAAGLRCHLVLLHEPPSEHARLHLLAAARLGAVLHAGTRRDRDDPRRAVARFTPRETPYVIPMGGTCPIGNLGYVRCAAELVDDVRAGRLVAPDIVFVASGTTGTAAGLLLGLRLYGFDAHLVAVRVSGPRTANRARVLSEVDAMVQHLAREDRLDAVPSYDDARFELEERFAGEGYARADRASRAALARGQAHGIPLDLTYTAKTFCALLARTPFLAGRHVLFIDTFDPRRLPIDGVEVADLPRALRGYASLRGEPVRPRSNG